MTNVQFNGDLRELDRQDLERMRLPRRFWGCTVDDVSSESESGRSGLDFVNRYFENFETFLNAGIGAVLWGANGRGKTGMAVVIAKMARRASRLVLFLAASDLKRVVIDNEVFDEEQTIWERACAVDVLVIDDLGKGTEDRTGFGMRLVDDLIRKRSAAQKVTLITTNFCPEPLRAALKRSTMETLKECVTLFYVGGPDRRLRDKARIDELFSGMD